MNNDQQTTIHESLLPELSAQHSMGDIYYSIDNAAHTVTLDFRQTPMIKLDAIARIDQECVSPCRTLDGARARLMSSLFWNYWNGILKMDDSSDYELVLHLNPSIWQYGSGFVVSLKTFFKPVVSSFGRRADSLI